MRIPVPMITNTIDCPCLGCEDRMIGCHGKCEKYTVYKDNVEIAKEQHRKQALVNAITQESITAGMKRKQRQKGGNR